MTATTRTRRPSYGVNRDDWWKLEEILVGDHGGARPLEFNPDSASLRGRAVNGYNVYTGQLQGGALEAFNVNREMVDYVVFSYATPIAWHVNTGVGGWWVMPETKYSITTTKHQGRVRTALHTVTVFS
jgi:hypothetical protein